MITALSPDILANVIGRNAVWDAASSHCRNWIMASLAEPITYPTFETILLDACQYMTAVIIARLDPSNHLPRDLQLVRRSRALALKVFNEISDMKFAGADT